MMLFYLHIAVMSIILIADMKGTLEPAVIELEKKMGIYTDEKVEVKEQ